MTWVFISLLRVEIQDPVPEGVTCRGLSVPPWAEALSPGSTGHRSFRSVPLPPQTCHTPLVISASTCLLPSCELIEGVCVQKLGSRVYLILFCFIVLTSRAGEESGLGPVLT